jgi:hypothetical protein
MGDTSLQRDSLVFRAAGRLTRGAGVSALAMLDNFGAANQRADVRNVGDILAISLHSKFEVLVGIEALCIHRELCH